MDLFKLNKFLDKNKLYGRIEIIKKIERVYQYEQDDRCLFINGFHAIGKTTLILNYCFNKIENKTDNLFYIDFQSLNFASEEAFINLIRNELNINGKNKSKSKSFDELFALELEEHIESMPNNSIIIFDEVERFLEFFNEKKFIQMLRVFARINRSYKKDEKMPLIVVVTKNDWIDREWKACKCESPILMRFVRKITLGAIDEDSCKSYIDSHLEMKDINEAFRRETIDAILLLAGGHPYIMNEALKILNDVSIKNTEDLVKILGEGLIVSCRSYLEKIWDDISDSEKEIVVSTIAGEFSKFEGFKYQKDEICMEFYGTNELVIKGILQENSRTTFSPLFTWWVLNNAKMLFEEFDKNKNSMDIAKVKNIFDIVNTSTIIAKTFGVFLKSYFFSK